MAVLPVYLALYQDLQLAIAAACILFGFVILPPSRVSLALVGLMLHAGLVAAGESAISV